MTKTRIFFIGGGNMAHAIFAKLCTKSYDVTVIQLNDSKREVLSNKYPNIKFKATLEESLEHNDIVILAVKPIDAQTTLLKICDKIKAGIFISVMAGINTQTLKKWILNHKIIRTMPNTPSEVGYGLTGIYFNDQILQVEQEQIKDLFMNIGKIFVCDREELIDGINAIAGSAPAYVFYFLESMIQSAVNQFGFSHEDAKTIAIQVASGSLKLIEHNQNISIEQLRLNVTSKNGTTERAINVFKKHNLQQIVQDAELACYNRAQEISLSFAENI